MQKNKCLHLYTNKNSEKYAKNDIKMKKIEKINKKKGEKKQFFKK